MKILQLCKKFPYPPKDGESIAITNLSHSLVEAGCQVDLLAMNTSRHRADLSNIGNALNHYRKVQSVDIDNRLNFVDAISNLLRGKSYHISRFESAEFEARLVEMLKSEEYDVIQLETLYLTPYLPVIRKYSKALLAMRAHNVEYEIWDKITQNTKLLPKKWYLRKLTNQLQNYEVEHLNEFDFLIAISDDDLKKFKNLGYLNGAVSTPVGVPIDQYKEVEVSCRDSRSMSFIGSLDWIPNLEGLDWFLRKVMPRIENVTLHVAGRNTPDYLLSRKQQNVEIHGEVEDAQHFIQQHPVMVVPLLSGSGMRVKILEGMALGKAIITTTKGAEGIGATDGENLLIANSPDEFVAAIQSSFENAERTAQIGKAARQFIEEEYDSVEVAKKLKSAYQYVISSDYAHP